MEYDDIFELLEAVRTYKLKPKETIISMPSAKGTHAGFCTADGNVPSTRWSISLVNLKKSCEARTSQEADDVYWKMRLFHLRKSLVEDLRSGKLKLEERPAPSLGSRDDLSMADFLDLDS